MAGWGARNKSSFEDEQQNRKAEAARTARQRTLAQQRISAQRMFDAGGRERRGKAARRPNPEVGAGPTDNCQVPYHPEARLIHKVHPGDRPAGTWNDADQRPSTPLRRPVYLGNLDGQVPSKDGLSSIQPGFPGIPEEWGLKMQCRCQLDYSK
ncbi:uncharacterized protein TRIVIDRAFT_66460 [Trichoderma virens Gv29-8]|uniref:Uncharacterized protein n=1 Tax=Hypocrea virens (strain Gv29-8 / FGSC 10586) TaxID=413071 RepID=G9N743_HYPVG|nr:uncharacterized protein TRIVIDRAFT_66460 [Trichoderma virens Gv29-8]EHK17541.1 hypothetical protein TRIVIDRAFT_66460 [Trichoderma virens Gv29-8]UKZ53739.1 hypothetical protein TrVGV298_007538 [Trichoderma virens]